MKARAALVTALLAPLFATAVAWADYGPRAEIRAARLAELHRWHIQCPPSRCADPILDIIVVDRYALIDWSTNRGEGQSLLEYAPTKGWYRLAHGGGEMGEGILAALTGDAAARKLWIQYKAYAHRAR